MRKARGAVSAASMSGRQLILGRLAKAAGIKVAAILATLLAALAVAFVAWRVREGADLGEKIVEAAAAFLIGLLGVGFWCCWAVARIGGDAIDALRADANKAKENHAAALNTALDDAERWKQLAHPDLSPFAMFVLMQLGKSTHQTIVRAGDWILCPKEELFWASVAEEVRLVEGSGASGIYRYHDDGLGKDVALALRELERNGYLEWVMGVRSFANGYDPAAKYALTEAGKARYARECQQIGDGGELSVDISSVQLQVANARMKMEADLEDWKKLHWEGHQIRTSLGPQAAKEHMKSPAARKAAEEDRQLIVAASDTPMTAKQAEFIRTSPFFDKPAMLAKIADAASSEPSKAEDGR